MKSHPLQDIWNSLASELDQPVLSGIVRRFHTMGEQQQQQVHHRKRAAPRQARPGDFVGALSHGIALLECWQESDVWLSNAELAARSGLTKPTVSRLASVLVGLGYLSRENRRGRLRLTVETVGLGFGSAFASEPVAGMHDGLARLAKDLDVYAALSIRRIDKVQVLDNVASPYHPHAVPMDVGGLLPLCRSASGYAALSALPDAEARPLLERLRTRYGARWQSVQRQLSRTKEEYSSNGYCTSIATLSQDVAAVAMPIAPPGSDDIFIIACGMPATEFDRHRVEREIVPQMQRVVQGACAALVN